MIFNERFIFMYLNVCVCGRSIHRLSHYSQYRLGNHVPNSVYNEYRSNDHWIGEKGNAFEGTREQRTQVDPGS